MKFWKKIGEKKVHSIVYWIKKGVLRMSFLNKKVKDLTIEELKELIKEAIWEIIDPDYGLELKEEAVISLKESIKEKEEGKGISIDKVKKLLNME